MGVVQSLRRAIHGIAGQSLRAFQMRERFDVLLEITEIVSTRLHTHTHTHTHTRTHARTHARTHTHQYASRFKTNEPFTALFYRSFLHFFMSN